MLYFNGNHTIKNINTTAQCPNCYQHWVIDIDTRTFEWYASKGHLYMDRVFCTSACVQEFKARGDQGRPVKS